MSRPTGMPDDYPFRVMTEEQFEALLIEVRNGTTMQMTRLIAQGITPGAEERADEAVEDLRAVVHAAEVALGILKLGTYSPKKEAMTDVRRLLEWYAGVDEDLPG